MAQAYTAPNWSTGEGISPSNLQSISNALEGIVQGSDKAIHNIAINGSNLVATYVDGTSESFTVSGMKGIAEVTKSSSGNVDTYTIIFTDGTTYSFDVTNGGGGGSASEVSYNNAVTQIEATNVQDAIDSVFTSVSNGKELVASAITDKGIPTLATDTFAIMAEHIAEIEGGASGGGQTYNKFYSPVGGEKTDQFTSTMNGTLKITAFGYMDGMPVVKINNVQIQPTSSYQNKSRYAYGAYFEIAINKDDVVRMTGYGTGDSYYALLCSIVGDGMDIADTTAIESDVAIGKIFHKANGTRAVGTLEAPKLTSGQIHLSTSASTNIDCGFKPKVVNILMGSSYTSVGGVQLDYVESISTSNQWVSGNSYALPTTTNNRIGSINENGFTLTKVSSASYSYCTWYAIG